MVAPPLTPTAPLSDTTTSIAVTATIASPPDRTVQLSDLANSLFDLRIAYESGLRALTSVQRSLERARRPRATSGEAALLMEEIGRLLTEIDGNAGLIAQHQQSATAFLTALTNAEAVGA